MGNLSSNNVATLLNLGADAMDNMFDVTIMPPAGLTSFEGSGMDAFEFGSARFKNDITIRASGFKAPEFTIKTYKVGYKAIEVDRPATKIEGERQFEMTFRLDANYMAYRFLGAWKSLVMNASTGYATNALYGSGDSGVSGDREFLSGVGGINSVFGSVHVSALSRPIHMLEADPFEAHGVTAGKFENGGLSVVSPLKPTARQLAKWEFTEVWITSLTNPDYKTNGGDAIEVTATFKFGNFKDPIYNAYAK
jgi:hypothetical protein